MSGVDDFDRKCPICGGKAHSFLDTKTYESEFRCEGACGYWDAAEIKITGGQIFWVVTTWYPMTEAGKVLRPPEPGTTSTGAAAYQEGWNDAISEVLKHVEWCIKSIREGDKSVDPWEVWLPPFLKELLEPDDLK